MNVKISMVRHKKIKSLNELYCKNIMQLIDDTYTTNDVIEMFKNRVDDTASRTAMNVNNSSYIYNLEDTYIDISKMYRNRGTNHLLSRCKLFKEDGYDYNKDLAFHKNTIYKISRVMNHFISELTIAVSNDKLIDNFDKYLMFLSYDFKAKKFYLFQLSRVNMFNDLQTIFNKDVYLNYAKMFDGIYYDCLQVEPNDLKNVIDRLNKNNYKISLIIGAKGDLIDNKITLEDYLKKVNDFYDVPEKFYCISGNNNFKFDDKYFVKD